ncbi:MAG: LamG-like jellyroll fold domain-containing protein [Clostridia bacterium]|nr:LamG-like jellyroll fold domain-containing protein [Clostridia bacterium]
MFEKALILCVITSLAIGGISMPRALARTTSRTEPSVITDTDYMYPSFSNGEVLLNKKQGRLPAMGWNSWNAFGSGNTEVLTKAMADKIVELGLDKLGYEYVVLDDGCYKSARVNGALANETTKFPGGFKALSDFMHSKGLKFGMYNDIGTNLCAGAAVGTCGYEDLDAETYLSWGVDFLKVDNCYYLWDNATGSASTNTKYTYAPNIRSIRIIGSELDITLNAVSDGVLLGRGASKNSGNYVTGIGTFDGTNIGTTPVGEQSGELCFNVEAPQSGTYRIIVNYASGEQPGTGRWLQLAVGDAQNETRYFDDLLPLTSSVTAFEDAAEIEVVLNRGENIIRLMNHRRQENTLNSYAALLDGLNAADAEHDVLLSICEWGKTQPQNWGYKVGNSWRILNDISFSVGSDGNPGTAAWSSNNTASITSQYNKAVIMDEFAGLDRGWNDPDMLVIGMKGITDTMNKTHMTMWCMMNSPLMLGMDLRNVEMGDAIYNIIANKNLIDLNQDALGIQAKRIYCSLDASNPDTSYITNNDRIDILAKPLANGDVALSFINLSASKAETVQSVDTNMIAAYIGGKMTGADVFQNAHSYYVTDLWSGESEINSSGVFAVGSIDAYDSVTIRISPMHDAATVRGILGEKISSAQSLISMRNDLDKPVLKKAENELNAAVDSAIAVCNDASSDIDALLGSCSDIVQAVETFEAVYTAYDEFENTILISQNTRNSSDKYVQDEAWNTFVTAFENGSKIYEKPQSLADMAAANNELIAARNALKRNLGDGFAPTAWYTFDSVNGTTVADRTGNGNDAKLVNSGAKITDNRTLSLNQSNENDSYMELPAGLLSDAEDFTLAAWVNLDEYRSWARLFDFGISSTQGYMFVCPYGGSAGSLIYSITATTNTAEQTVAASAPAVKTWAHIAVIQSGESAAIYVNGEKTAEAAVTNTPKNTIGQTANYYIGKSQWADPYLKAEIKDVRIYDKALTEEQLQKIMSDFGQTIAAIPAVKISTALGEAPKLPDKIEALNDDGGKETVDVTWDAYDETNLSKGEAFSVYGTVAGSDVRAQADIVFTSMSLHDDFLAMVTNETVDAKKYVYAVVSNAAPKPKVVRMYLAEHAADGALESIKVKSGTLAPKSYEEFYEELSAENAAQIYLWDESQKPIIAKMQALPYAETLPVWNVVRPNSANVYSNAENSITVTTETGDFWGKNDGSGTVRNLYLIDIPENTKSEFTVEVKVIAKPAQNYQRVGLIVCVGDGNQVTVMRRYHSGYGGNVFMTTMNTNGSAASESVYTPDTAGEECYLMLKKTGAEFKGYFSVDGKVTWSELETRTQSVIDGADTVRAGFYASNGEFAAAAAEVMFEDFTLNGTPIPFCSDDAVTTEEFTAMLMGSISDDSNAGNQTEDIMECAKSEDLIEDYDIENRNNPIERRAAARIIHNALLNKLGEDNEDNWQTAWILEDLYSCRACVENIAQVYVKGIMQGKTETMFDATGNLTRAEAAEVIARAIDKKQRISIRQEQEAKAERITAEAAFSLMRDSGAVLVDVRSFEEYEKGHIKDSICIPLEQLSNNPYAVSPDKNAAVILYCQRGYKSMSAAQLLIAAGYSKVYTVLGIEQYDYDLQM